MPGMVTAASRPSRKPARDPSVLPSSHRPVRLSRPAVPDSKQPTPAPRATSPRPLGPRTAVAMAGPHWARAPTGLRRRSPRRASAPWGAAPNRGEPCAGGGPCLRGLGRRLRFTMGSAARGRPPGWRSKGAEVDEQGGVEGREPSLSTSATRAVSGGRSSPLCAPADRGQASCTARKTLPSASAEGRKVKKRRRRRSDSLP